MNETRTLFLKSCEVVAGAVEDGRVSAAWDKPSVLADQTVGAIAAHTARGCWVVCDYLDEGVPTEPANFDSAADYFAKLLRAATPEMHEGIRQRGSDGAATGPHGCARLLREKLPVMQSVLETEPDGRLVNVYGGNAMTLDDYLETRLVEQVVHLNDLALSIGTDPWPNAEGAEELVLSIGLEIGRARFGTAAMIRALFRGADDSPLRHGVTA